MNKLNRYAWMASLALMMPVSAFAATAAEGREKSLESDPMHLYFLEMVWAVVLFSLFAAILGVVVWPKVLGALQAREQKLEGDLVGAESARKEAEATLAEYKAKIAEAQKESQQVVEQARATAEQLAAKVKSDAESELAKVKERAAAEVEAAKDAALSEVYAQMAELSTQIAGKILKREISAADQQALVAESLGELAKSRV